MSSPRENTSTSATAQPFQFRLWQALTLLTGTAVLFACASPYLRLLSTSHWRLLGLCLAAFLAGVVPSTLFLKYQGLPPRGLGIVRHRTAMYAGGRRLIVGMFLGLGLMMGFNGVVSALSSTDMQLMRIVGLSQLFNSGLMFVAALQVYRGHSVWLCDDGLSIGFRTRRWSEVSLVDGQYELSLKLRLSWLWSAWIDFPDAESREFVLNRVARRAPNEQRMTNDQ